ncbi:hypothetical protein [Streptomyces broussonetiae]|uniref:Uncharacterized protein n=1 Tax=Streptomyces broussonetiae TaxID=2686304 RepID=A0A6I6MRS3_9ACTN|nr:hypothetical protein [Streptomyces broussonetiae]QHA03268.1 hypothetical protein GQF42_08335 [Streptomyces broussonetiae]
MNAEESNSADRHPHIRNIVEKVTEHHRRAKAEREESVFEDAIDGAAFDLAADIAHPTAGQAEFGYDVDTDLGVEPR